MTHKLKSFKEWLKWRDEYFKLNNKFHGTHLNMTAKEAEKTKENCRSLLSDIILTAEEQDTAHKVAAIKAGKGSQAVGQSWMVFHLKTLKEHLDEVL